MAEAMKYLAMAIAASRRLGWIALGLYIERMSTPAPLVVRARYKTSLEHYRAIEGYQFKESIMAWADDYRMVLFPNELDARIEAIDEGWEPFYIKEQRKKVVLRRAERAKQEIDGA